MGLFDFFNETKESIDRGRQAREYISQAKDYIRSGEEIYEKAYDKVTAYASETEYELRKHSEYKKKLAQELGSSVGNILKNFSQFNIDSKIITAPTIQNSAVSSTDISIFQASISSCMPRLDIPSIFDMFISDDDYREAKRQRDEAKRYRERMKTERERLYNYKEKMSEIRSFISSEKSELDSLMEKVKKMTRELQTGMQKSSFTKEEADYLKGIHKITEYMVTLLSTEFLNDSFFITQKYQSLFEGIKNINRNLPYAPSISDTNTLAVLRSLLDGTIVY